MYISRDPWRLPHLALLFLPLLLAGCAGVLQTLQDVANLRPTAEITGVRLRELDLRSLTLEFDVAIENPYSFELPLLDFDFDLRTNAQPFLNGSTKVGGSVPPSGSRIIPFPVRVDLIGLVETIRSVRPGQVIPYEAEMGLSVDVSGSGPIRLPLRQSGELPVPTVPSVSVQSFYWDSLSLSEVRGNVALSVGNTNEFPFALRRVDYDLSLANTNVAQGVNEDGLDLAPGAEGILSIPLSFSPSSAGLALLNMLRGDEASYSILGSMALETPFGPTKLPFQRSGSARSEN